MGSGSSFHNFAAFGSPRAVEFDDWHFNVRSSNTEPLLRLNVEARDAETMASLRDRALAIIREEH